MPFSVENTPDANEQWIAMYVGNLRNKLPEIERYLNDVGRQTPIHGKMFNFNSIDL